MIFKHMATVVTIFFSSLVCFISTVTANNETWILAQDQESKVVVVVNEHASAVERHAAEELRHFLGKMAQARIEQSPQPVDGLYNIWLGTPSTNVQIDAMNLRQQVESLSDHGFLLRTHGSDLIIAGKTPLGVLYGVYAFLEEHLGIRWLFPGKEGQYIPKVTTLSIGPIDDIQNPAFQERLVVFDGSAITTKTIDSWNWVIRNRMHFNVNKHVYGIHREELEKRGVGLAVGGHVLMNFVPDELIDDHPEYFALIDGERHPQRSPEGRHLSQPCTTHPQVVRLVTDGILRMLEQDPEGGSYRFLNNDVSVWCECDNCLAIAPSEERKRPGGRLSTRFFSFKNEVADQVWQQMPDANIRAYAYQEYRLPPLGVQLDSRFTVILCDHDRCFRHSLDDPHCQGNTFFREMYEGWAELPNVLGNYSYYNAGISGSEGRPLNRPVDRVVARDLRYMHRLGFTHWAMRTMPPDGGYEHLKRRGRDITGTTQFWRANLHMLFIQAKLAWNPDLDFDELFDDINEKFYGPAAEPMGYFRRELLTLWEQTPGDFMYGTDWRLYGKSLMAPGAADRLLDLLDQAEQAASGEPTYLARIAEDRDIFENTWLAAYEEYRQRPDEAVQAKRAAEPIVIDGRLDERDWQESERVTGFVRRESNGELAQVQTYVRILYDDEHLYLGLEMQEPDTSELHINASHRDDSAIWRDDTIEVFIDPEGQGRQYVHFAVNADGVFRDSLRDMGMPTAGDVTFDTDAEIAAHVGDGVWSVEMKISAKSLGADMTVGNSWRMNVMRARRAQEPEVSSWMDGQVHEPHSFRRIVFGQSVLRNGNFADLVAATERNLGVVGEKFLNHWGVNAQECEVIEGLANRVRLSRGTIYSFLRFPAESPSEERMLHGEIIASGEGTIQVRMSTAVRTPGDRQPFSHDIRTELEPFTLGPEPDFYRFEYALKPHERGYVYIYALDEAVLHHASLVLD